MDRAEWMSRAGWDNGNEDRHSEVNDEGGRGRVGLSFSIPRWYEVLRKERMVWSGGGN